MVDNEADVDGLRAAMVFDPAELRPDWQKSSLLLIFEKMMRHCPSHADPFSLHPAHSVQIYQQYKYKLT